MKNKAISPIKPRPSRLKKRSVPFLVILSFIFFMRVKRWCPASLLMQKKGS
jgi:hypothetical protein